jgi:NTE family protein
MVVQERGLLWRAVRASLSIPGIFAPVIDERGHLLVDGGIMNNFPVDVLRARLGTGRIIGMNVGQVASDDQPYAYEGGLSGWQVLRSRFDPRAEPIAAPSLASILVRAMMVNNQRQVQQSQQLCDLLIEPAVQRFGLLQFTEYAAIAELGYATAQPALAEWKARHFDHPQ